MLTPYRGLIGAWRLKGGGSQTHLDLAASHGVVTGPFFIVDQANGPPHFTAISPAFLPTQISKPLRYFFVLEGLFLVSGVTVTELMGR